MSLSHPDFRVRNEEWLFNWRKTPEDLDCKIRFGFANTALLDDCPFYAKIGKNLDPIIPQPYIGFAYAPKSQILKLVSWARRFDRADLIVELDRNAASQHHSKVQKIV